MKKSHTQRAMIATVTLALAASSALAQQKAAEPPSQVLFKNVNVFDGAGESLPG